MKIPTNNKNKAIGKKKRILTGGLIPKDNFRSPRTSRVDPPRKFSFSFRFFRQIQYFGLDRSASKWFVSLLERLRELSKESIDDFVSNRSKQIAHRWHEVNWLQKNIPIKREELDWIENRYLKNQAEYPLMQFQISTALGRVVGFLDDASVFNIVLLDPFHNIQPSINYNYKVDPCFPLSCKYTTILRKIETLISKNQCKQSCSLVEGLKEIKLDLYDEFGVFVLPLSKTCFDKIQNVIEEGKCNSVEEILEWGLCDLAKEQQAN